MGSSIYMALAAMVLLSVFILSSNTLIQRNSQIVNESEYLITAISLAQNLLDEAKTKAFDENLVSGSKDIASVLGVLTTVLGRESSEIFQYPDLTDTVTNQIFNSAKVFNDFDDYNGYTRIVDTKRAESFKVSSIVQYVDPGNPDATKSSPTFCKRMTVIVDSPYLTTPVLLNYAMIY
jgi:hypothetical protein